MLTKLAKKIHETAKEKGFWRGKRNIDELHMLILTELAEAVEADRKGRHADLETFNQVIDIDDIEDFNSGMIKYIRGSVEEEIADTIIRILDYLWHDKNEYFIIPTINPEFSDNFAQNIFKISKQVCDWRLTDALALLMKLSEHMEIDILQIMQLKMKYNEGREELHGKKY